MGRRLVRFCAALAVAGSSAATLASQQRQTFRAGANLVVVDAYPQRDGRVVEGLARDDFQVLEDGKPQTIDSFDFIRVEPGLSEAERRDPNTQEEGNELAADPRNRVFVLYLDAYHVTVGGSHATRSPLVDMLNRVLAPNDLFAFYTPMMRPRDLIFGRRLLTIEEQLSRYWMWGQRQQLKQDAEEDFIDYCFTTRPSTVSLRGGPDSTEWWFPDGGQMRLIKDLLKERLREDRTLTSLEALVPRLGQLREARTVLMVFTDGWVLFENDVAMANEVMRARQHDDKCANLGLRLAQLDDRYRSRRLIETANRNNVSFYPVAPGGLQAFDTNLGDRVAFNPNSTQPAIVRETERLRDRVTSLQTLAENTDGLAVVNTNDLKAGLSRIVNDVSAYYLLGYYSTNPTLDGKFRKIQVKVKPPGLSVRARRGYLAVAAAPAASSAGAGGASAGPSPVDEALAVLSRLRPSSEVFVFGAATSSEIAVVAEITSAQIESGRWAKGGEVHFTLTGPNGEAVGSATSRIDPGARGAMARIARPPGLDGPWHVAVTVGSGADRLEDRGDVSAAPGTVLGPTLVYRATPAPRSPLRPVADFQFRRTERVHVEWPILMPLDRREARLLDRKGQPLAVAVTVTERENAGTSVLAADLTLAPLTEGDYVIELTAGSAAQTERKFVGIRVVR